MPFLDTMVGFYLFYFLIGGIVAFVGVSFLEGIILRLMRWGTLSQSMRDSFAVNFMTTALGYILTFLGMLRFFGPSAGVFAEPPYGSISGWIFMWAISVLIEALLFWSIRRQASSKTWVAAITINACSYLLLAFFGVRGSLFFFPYA